MLVASPDWLLITCITTLIENSLLFYNRPLWEDLKYCKIPLMFVVGEKDAKFKNISQDICREMGQATNHETVEVPNSGHAVHLENPLAIIRLVRQFLTKQSF